MPTSTRTTEELEAENKRLKRAWDSVNTEREELLAAIDEALLCLTLIGHAGKTWGEKAHAAKDVLARVVLHRSREVNPK